MGCGGCLWSFVPLLILIPLYTIIRQPLTNMLGATDEIASEIGNILGANMKDGYWQISAAQAIFDDPSRFANIPGITEKTLAGINFNFLGIEMGIIPQINIFNSEVWAWDWAHIGAAIVPLISAASQVLQIQISRRMNDSLVTNEKGIQDKEEAAKSQSAQTSKIMTWMSPLMSLWIGFSVPVALSLYWFVGGVVRTIEDTILTKKYRAIYDAEDAERLKKAMEQDAIEAEKERIRAEKRAANPDGITENTSKKKLQKKQQQAEEAAKAAAKKEYDAKKGIVEEEPEEKKTLSGIADRPYCKGRAYDPNRYNTEE
jgi:YidC/Oxa1 family membrane protein insertase